MNTQSFSIFKAIDFGFRMFARNIWLMLGLMLAGVTVQFIANTISNIIFMQSGLSTCQKLEEESKSAAIDLQPGETERHAIGRAFGALLDKFNKGQDCYKKNILPFMLILLVYLLALILQFVLLMGWDRIALDLYDNGTSSFNRIFVTFPLFFSYLVGFILYSFMFGIGLLLLIIPGIIWLFKYSFFGFIIIDTGCGPIEALRKSGQLTYGHKWRLFLFFAPLLIINVTVSYITIIGTAILAPLFVLPCAYIYRTLQGMKQHSA